MSDELRVRLVRIAEFTYRHEAEFAAGFLTDADIPFQLQVDDAMMGMGSTTASLWVRDRDRKDAVEILGSAGLDPADVKELEEMAESAALEDGSRSADNSDAELFLGTPPPSASDSGQRFEASRHAPVRHGETAVRRGTAATSLDGQARLVSVAFGVGAGASTLALPVAFPSALSIALLLVAALFISAGLAGRAPEPLRSFLQAIAGGAP